MNIIKLTDDQFVVQQQIMHLAITTLGLHPNTRAVLDLADDIQEQLNPTEPAEGSVESDGPVA